MAEDDTDRKGGKGEWEKGSLRIALSPFLPFIPICAICNPSVSSVFLRTNYVTRQNR